MVQGFKEEAQHYGDLIIARAFADWSRHTGANLFEKLGIEPKFILPGQRNASFEIAKEVNAILRSDEHIDTFILATNETNIIPTVQKLQAQGHKVVLWADKDLRDSALDHAVDEFTPVEEILTLREYCFTISKISCNCCNRNF